MIFHELGRVAVHELVDLGFARPSWPPTRLKQVIFPFQIIHFNENLKSSNCDCMHDINLTSITTYLSSHVIRATEMQFVMSSIL
jgi:hypothetical protein